MTSPTIRRQRTNRFRPLAMTAFGLALAACTDNNGLTAPGGSADYRYSNRNGTLAADTSASPPASAGTILRFATWAPKLTTYDTTFTVVQGKASADTIYFVKRPIDFVPVPFMILSTPADGQFVDSLGRSLQKGSTVKLTVKVDTAAVEIHFGPHGSTFAKSPAQLKIFWLFTDLMGHKGSDLRMWYQPTVGTDWTKLSTAVNMDWFWLISEIDHFSNYHVAY
jgi:hypothetical protein